MLNGMERFFGRREQFKFTVTLTEMELVDAPPMTARIYAKIKQGSRHVQTPSVSIVSNRAHWTDPIVLECNHNQHSRSSHQIRLSFRIENPKGNKFTRFGVVELELPSPGQKISMDVSKLLENCTYNTYFKCHYEVVQPGSLSKTINEEEEPLEEQSTSIPVFERLTEEQQQSLGVNTELLQELEREVDEIFAEVALQ